MGGAPSLGRQTEIRENTERLRAGFELACPVCHGEKFSFYTTDRGVTLQVDDLLMSLPG